VASLWTIASLVTAVVVAYRVSSKQRFTARGIASYACALAGAFALLAGFTLAVKEADRGRYGRVTSGVVVERLSSTGEEGTRFIGRRSRRRPNAVVTANGFQAHESLARIMIAGSPRAWVVDYRFGCAGGRMCRGRDFVSEALWRRVRPGQSINVRQADGEATTARLDENPQWPIALAQLGIGAALLLVAAALSRRGGFLRRRVWLTAPAIVTGVEPIKHGDHERWRIRFAYFDRDGAPQESADEVPPGRWKSGDPCVAVYRPEKPALATLRPAPGAPQSA
jgi:hypothetical protein